MKIAIISFFILFLSINAIDSPLELLPIDIQKYLCLFFIEKNSEKTNGQNCFQSIRNLRSFLSSCKKFYKFLDDVHFASSFINNLDHDQEDINLSKILHATRLNTSALNKYVKNILDNNPNTKARLINLIVINCLNNDHPKKHLQFLVETGISPDDDNSNFTPLTAAACWGNIDKIDLLLKHGANINKKNPRGNAALHEAVGNHQIDAVRFLIEKKANINLCDNNNETALIRACRLGFKGEIVELLLKNNADRSIKNSEGKTAEEIVQLWKDHWAGETERNPDYCDEWMSEQLTYTLILELFKKYPQQP